MATELLGRRSSRSPAKIYTRRSPKIDAGSLSSATSSSRTTSSRVSSSSRKSLASSLQLFSSAPTLRILDAHFQSQQSSIDNHTERLQASESEVIMRRGNTLILKITTSIELSTSYVVSLTFVPVFRPRERFGQFRAKGIAKGSCNLWLSISLPTSFPVGKYHAHISLSLKGGTELITHFHHKAIVVLFNPCNPDDDTFIKDEAERKAYLFDEVGTIWRGTDSHKVPLLWEYGQYGEHSLDVALYLLRTLTADECRSASTVTRSLVAQINCRDNSGVLLGSSGGSHIGATHPCRWTGSTCILSKYYHTKTPVRSGQCWVFAGVAVSLLRALGIACRPVTCYNAAHYCQKLSQAERYFSIDGDLIHDIGRDQIWVYHVWCEAWMRRSDLPEGYDGWQVLDPTSQDRQSGRYRIGPASVIAAKEGHSGKKWPYDLEFVKSEVGADVRYLRVSSSYSTVSSATTSLAHVNHNEVATSLVTTSCGEDWGSEPLDITNNYRNIPPTPSEPSSESSCSQRFPSPTRDCFFEVEMNDGAKLGEDIKIKVSVRNGGGMLRTVDGKVVGSIIYYTGQPVHSFMTMQFSGQISPGQGASVSLPIGAKKYMRSLVEQCMVQFFIIVKIRESKQLFLKVHPFQLLLPQLKIQCPETVTHGNTFRIKISFTNILHLSLTRILFLVQGQALCPQRELSNKRLVLPGAIANVEFSLRAHVIGSFTLLVSMFCDQLTDVRGQAKVTIQPSPE